jgi:hypothetical protein
MISSVQCRWLTAGVLTAFGCGGGGSVVDDEGGESIGSTAATVSLEDGGESTTTTTTSPGEGEAEGEAEATTDYPTHVSCDDTSAGYDVPSLDDGGGEMSGGAEDTFDGMGDDIPIGATVFEVRMGGLEAGSYVEVADLVITSPVGPRPNGGAMVFAQSPEGGKYSAITLVFDEASTAGELGIGTRVRVVGRVGERYVFTAIFVDPYGVTLEGGAIVPPPVVLQPADLEPGSETAAAYESALVRVLNPEVEVPDSCIGEFTLDVGVGVDDLFLGADAPDPAAGDEFSAVTGPLRYTYNGFEIAPRTLADVEP